MNLDFSVCMSVYKNDSPNHFYESLQSIIKQTYRPKEIVLVVDGPVSMEILRVINEFENQIEYFHTIRLNENVGLGNALRIGIENCKFELVARMDSDDVAVSDRFEKQLLYFQNNPDISIVGGQISEFIDRTDNIIGIRNCPITDPEIKEYIKRRCPFNHMTVMFNKEHVLNVGNYVDWKFNEDYYLWLRMYLAGYKFYNLPDILVNVRVGNEMYSRRGGLTYFKSEAKLQKYMYKNGVTNLYLLITNIFIRFVIQLLLPNKIRGFIYKKMLRK